VYLIYEEHVLGPRKVKAYEVEVQKIFEAVRKQFALRLQAKRLNLTTSQISSVQKILSFITVSVGNVPRIQGYRRYLTDFYAYINLEDDFSTIHLKALRVHTQLRGAKI